MTSPGHFLEKNRKNGLFGFRTMYFELDFKITLDFPFKYYLFLALRTVYFLIFD